MNYLMFILCGVMIIMSIFYLVRPFFNKQYDKQERELVFVASKGNCLFQACEKLSRSYIIFLKNGSLLNGTYFSDEEIKSNGRLEELPVTTNQRAFCVNVHRKAAFIYVSKKKEYSIIKRYPNLD